MVKGLRFILAGLVTVAVGGGLFTVPAEVGISWYEPAGAILGGLLLVAFGVYTISRGG
jgi:hypothetical protein